MKTVQLIQGTREWLSHRAAHWNASDAPAMLGVSPYKTRDQLLRELATGITADVDAMELPGEAVSIWLKHRATIQPLGDAARESAWRYLVARVEHVGKMKGAKAWLKRALADEIVVMKDGAVVERGDPLCFCNILNRISIEERIERLDRPRHRHALVACSPLANPANVFHNQRVTQFVA
mgnify:CR=1 FL=1